MGVRTNFRDNLKAFKEKKTRLNCTQGQRKGTGRENRPLGGKRLSYPSARVFALGSHIGGSSAPQRLHLWPRTTRYTRCLVGVDSDVKVEWRTTRRRGTIGCGARAVCLGFG
ncbi:hypothetical protein ES332_A07G081400v1 [Gossypium tomentosum]|uniref:Uncharacterized protein n=1 Tax=Gossypium tomentosum TaxID=34277 RepID=A0A5D2PSR4_GOSTO|nr:hypothetical protein ES332_A07G081400v1 [Gossypium tomentosum]